MHGSMRWGQLIFHWRCSWDGGGGGQGVKGEAGMMACLRKAVEVSREVAKQPRMSRERKVLGVRDGGDAVDLERMWPYSFLSL